MESTDEKIYSTDFSDDYFEYVRRNAKQYRDIGLFGENRIVTLSTCSYEFTNARMVLLARVAATTR